MYVLKESSMKLSEQTRLVYTAFPEAGTQYEDVLRPEYWAHVAAKLRQTDELIVTPEDLGWWAHLIVVHTSVATVIVKELLYKDLGAAKNAEIDQGDLTIKWCGPHAKFRIMRKSDGAILIEGDQVATRDMADAWVRDYRRALAA